MSRASLFILVYSLPGGVKIYCAPAAVSIPLPLALSNPFPTLGNAGSFVPPREPLPIPQQPLISRCFGNLSLESSRSPAMLSEEGWQGLRQIN